MRRRDLVIAAPFAAGEPETDDFLRCELSKTMGEFALETLDLPVELVLMVRSREGATAADTAGTVVFESSSGNKEYQFSETSRESPWNMGEVSKLSFMNGESLMSGEVMLVNVVEGGADWWGSAKMSLGDTVRIDPDTEGLIAVKAVAGASQEDISDWRPAYRLAPESKELLLFRSAMVATLLCEMLLLELENRGTGGRCCN